MSECQIPPIQTAQDHAAALARVEALMERARSADEDAEFDALVTRIETYEADCL